MTSQGTAHGRFTRAIERRHLTAAESAARELGRLSLPDALALCFLIAETDPARFGRAAARWHARFVLEAKGLDVVASRRLLNALASPTDAAARTTIAELARLHGVPGLERELYRKAAG
jgi:hypothetical protein